ncbi:MAG: cell division protein ZapE [Gammaproteobacteria bacterium]|nr:MAG: cell division protein ZapE [Gammaproteobacteria bacterium]
MQQQFLSPRARYEKDIKENDFSSDAAQLLALEKLDVLFYQLIKSQQKKSQLFKWFLKKSSNPVKGLYMWGGVGRGKTYLMDSFFEALPIKKKKRLHFHRFMYWVHSELTTLSGKSNPLTIIAEDLAKETSVLCFDEFFVSDISDAMILDGLLQEMFKRGISLVATSNIEPDKLYWNGLQRERFLGAIELIKQHTEILNVDGGIDYRLRTLEQAEIYHSPLDQAAIDNLNFSFTHLAVNEVKKNTQLVINGREIQVKAIADGIVWIAYNIACTSPRSARDYIEFSKLYNTVLLSDMPQLTDEVNDQVRRFISLVDEFYERGVKLIISAAVPMTELYIGSQLAREFKRTLSRLEEMQSHSYLARPHLP